MPPIMSPPARWVAGREALRRAAFIDSSLPARSPVIGASDHRQGEQIASAAPHPVEAAGESANRERRRRGRNPGAARGRVRRLAGRSQSRSSAQPHRRRATHPRGLAEQTGELAFARCMRSHGVPTYPDPTSTGLVKESLQQLGVSSSRFQSASSDCNHLLPNGGSGPSPAQVQRVRALALEFSQCVRSHGRSEFPRPGQRRPHTRPRHRWNQSGLAEVRGRKPGLPGVPAAVPALECRIQRLRQDTWVMPRRPPGRPGTPLSSTR